MGILNVTPDSFSEGGKYADAGAAMAHGQELIAGGASIIDVGGESTRPGSQPVRSSEQIRRIVPVIAALQARCLISVDTSRSEVAGAALDAGAHFINDIFAGMDDPKMFVLAAQRRVPIVLMHMQGNPATMQQNPSYENVVAEVTGFLRQRIDAAIEAGIEEWRILIDPGIGFGKGLQHNLKLLRQLKEFKALGRPLVVGTSRKGFIEKITGEPVESGRPLGTAATVAWSIAKGADIVRVHDARAMSQVVRMIEAIQNEGA